MTQIFSNDFEDNFDSWDGTNGSPTTSNTAYLGNKSGAFHTNGVYATKNLSNSDVYAMCYVKWESTEDNKYNVFLNLRNDSSAQHIAGVYVYKSGGIVRWGVRTPSNYYDSSQQTSPLSNKWYCVEVRAKCSATVGEIHVWIDGTELTDVAQTSINTIAMSVDRVQVGHRESNFTSNITFLIDAVKIADTYIEPFVICQNFDDIVLHNDDFESNDFSNWDWQDGSPTISSAQAHSGTRSLYASASGKTTTWGFHKTVSDLYIRYWVLLPTLPSNGHVINFSKNWSDGWSSRSEVHLYNNAGTYQWRIYESETDTNYTVNAGSVQTNTWYCIECRRRVGASNSGNVSLWINGTHVINQAITLANPIRYIVIGNVYSTATYGVYVDDYITAEHYIGPVARSEGINWFDGLYNEGATFDYSTDYAKSGSQSIKIVRSDSTADAKANMRKDVPSGLTEVWAGVHFYAPTEPPSNSTEKQNAILTIDSDTGSLAELVRVKWADNSYDCYFYYYKNSGDGYAWSLPAPPIGEWAFYQIHLIIGGSNNGLAELYLNDQLLTTSNSITNNGRGNPKRVIINRFGTATYSETTYFDNLMVAKTFIATQEVATSLKTVTDTLSANEATFHAKPLTIGLIPETPVPLGAQDKHFSEVHSDQLKTTDIIATTILPPEITQTNELMMMASGGGGRGDDGPQIGSLTKPFDAGFFSSIRVNGIDGMPSGSAVHVITPLQMATMATDVSPTEEVREIWGFNSGVWLPQFKAMPVGTSYIRFKYYTKDPSDLALVLVGGDPILTVSTGMTIKKDLSVGGFVGANQGKLALGHGMSGCFDVPAIWLSHSEHKKITFQSDSRFPPNPAKGWQCIRTDLSPIRLYEYRPGEGGTVQYRPDIGDWICLNYIDTTTHEVIDSVINAGIDFDSALPNIDDLPDIKRRNDYLFITTSNNHLWQLLANQDPPYSLEFHDRGDINQKKYEGYWDTLHIHRFNYGILPISELAPADYAHLACADIRSANIYPNEDDTRVLGEPDHRWHAAMINYLLGAADAEYFHASGNVTAKKIASIAGDYLAANAMLTTASKMIGVFAESKNNGEYVLLIKHGKATVTAGETLVAGDVVTTNNYGQAVKITVTVGSHSHNYSSTTGAGSAHTHPISVTSSEVGSHTHDYSSTTSAGSEHKHYINVLTSQGADHTHAYAGTTGVESANHHHSVSGSTTGNENTSHTHSYSAYAGYEGAFGQTVHEHHVMAYTDNEYDHTHTIGGTTSAENGHSHSISGSTGNGVGHTHGVSGTTSDAQIGITVGSTLGKVLVGATAGNDAIIEVNIH